VRNILDERKRFSELVKKLAIRLACFATMNALRRMRCSRDDSLLGWDIKPVARRTPCGLSRHTAFTEVSRLRWWDYMRSAKVPIKGTAVRVSSTREGLGEAAFSAHENDVVAVVAKVHVPEPVHKIRVVYGVHDKIRKLIKNIKVI